MSANSNISTDNKSSEATGGLLMIILSIIAATPIAIGFWASLTGGGFN
jgi:hypothetical protein